MFGKMIFYGIQCGTSSAAAVLINAPCLSMLWKIIENIPCAERCHMYLCK